jgi:hypothetical protein
MRGEPAGVLLRAVHLNFRQLASNLNILCNAPANILLPILLILHAIDNSDGFIVQWVGFSVHSEPCGIPSTLAA